MFSNLVLSTLEDKGEASLGKKIERFLTKLFALSFLFVLPRAWTRVTTECFNDLDNGGSVLSQFLLLPQLPQKMKLASKVVKIDSK
jgi:hypothetical protein